MTIENRNMHTTNCDVFIDHNKEVYQVNVADGLEIAWERKGVPGKCTFTLVQEDTDKVEFEEGDKVRVRISQTWMFFGFIFTKQRAADKLIKITCYDQLRYLKNKESVIFNNKSVGQIVKMIANDRHLNIGEIQDSTHKIPTMVKENSSFFDIIMNAMERTTEATGEMFILYDHFGKLTLKSLKSMYKNIVIDNSVIENFDYESTIDKQTYNMVRVSVKSGKDGAEVYYTKGDQKNIDRWGELQLTTKADNTFQAVTVAAKNLELYNSKTKTLRIKKAMGAVEIIAGSIIIVNLDLGDMKLAKNMVVDAVTHRVEDGLYSMDLDLIGGEFVSTRGVTQDGEVKKEKEKNNGDTLSNKSLADKDWGHGITPAMINNVLKGKLAGKGEMYVKFGNAYGVNPLLVALIQRMECGPNFDSRVARECNNFGGINSDPDYKQKSGRHVIYPSVDVGIERHFRLLGVKYLYDWGKKSIEAILNMYAPSFENNTNGYIASMKSWYRQFSGREWSNSLLGKGVASVEEARRRMQPISSTSTAVDIKEGNMAIVNEAMKHIGKNKFVSWFYPGLWCADFVTYCLKQSGQYKFSSRTSSCVTLASYYKSAGKLVMGTNYTPKPGDTIFFKSSRTANWTNHVGIVKEVSNGRIITIEGNTSHDSKGYSNGGWVASHSYGKTGISYARIVAYGKNS
ncbi:CHAP domain-containing protein [Peptostreptococcus equinus]|uniref:CHAP domain-containing protein n=1 Tax=Peptostreptococcus equinus TaxID=3003601 RepID=A0ABY7JQ37_9FIRM|nr:CHAP domain-containing protein [Peptostreptococcus sp. CBA3647]WAW15459.1 CHAP domain-containing protein [Peptostreptococcus sp. CBA3647]